MTRAAGKSEKWWLTLVVAIMPSLIAGWFSLRAIDKANASAAQAEKTSSELTVAYQLMKQAMEVVQHEADMSREALQKNNELLVKLLEQRRVKRPDPQAEVAMLTEARALNDKLNVPAPSPRPHFPTHLEQLLGK